MGERFNIEGIYDKREKARDAAMGVIEDFRSRGGRVDVNETEDTMTLVVRNERGEPIREFGLMKSENLVTGDIEEVVAAVLEFPEDDLESGLEKVRAKG